MEVTLKTFTGRQAILVTSKNEEIYLPISLLPTELNPGDSCYLHIGIPQDPENKKIRKMTSILESLIN